MYRLATGAGEPSTVTQATRSSPAAGRFGGGWRHYSSEAAQTRGPVSYISLALTVGTGGGLLYWFTREKDKKMEKLATKSVVVGNAAIGGPFELVDTSGRPFTDKDLLGEFALMYFGFTFCPDVCPEELEKIAAAADAIEKSTGRQVQLVFLSVDPERDGVEQVREYVREFHPRMIGLTGSLDKTKAAAAGYRVYYNKTNDAGDDYLVDHSIITYLINPEGKFVTFYGKNYTKEEMAGSIADHLRAWRDQHPDYQCK